MKRKSPSEELNLFGEENAVENLSHQALTQVDSCAGLKWSFSKHGILKQCPRRLYYQYYGGNVHQAKDEADKEQLRRLKLLVNREERTGHLLHLAIATYFRKAQQGEVRNSDGLMRWTLDIFKKDIEFSRQGLERAELSTDAKSPRFLMEYATEAESDELCSEAATNMIDALEQFLESPVFAGVRELGVTPENLVEKKFTRLACIAFGVEGQVDLAHRSDQGHITIVDWKSGENEGDGDESLQLAVYALWARETFGCTPDAMTVQKAFLDGRIVGDEYEFITQATEEVIQRGYLSANARIETVELRKQTEMQLRMWDIDANGVVSNVLEGTAIRLSATTAILATTGAGTLRQGTADPMLVVVQNGSAAIDAVTEAFGASAHLNWSSPEVAQRLPMPFKRTDEVLKARSEQEIRRIR